MQTLPQLKKRMASAGALRSIISSQKAVAAAELALYERASASIYACVEVLERAVQVVLPDDITSASGDATTSSIKIIIGSDLGLVGRFNRALAAAFVKEVKSGDTVMALGRNMAASLVSLGVAPSHEIAMPADAEGIADSCVEILESLGTLLPSTKVEVFFNKRADHLWRPERRVIAPITREYLAEIKSRKWPTKNLPAFTAPREEMLSYLLTELVLTGIGLALAASLAAEQLARLMTTQNAEKNIDEKLEDMTLEYQQRRQAEITEELIDVLNGAAAVA